MTIPGTNVGMCHWVWLGTVFRESRATSLGEHTGQISHQKLKSNQDYIFPLVPPCSVEGKGRGPDTVAYSPADRPRPLQTQDSIVLKSVGPKFRPPEFKH